MNPLKKEVQAVAAAISQPHENAEEAAKAAIKALDEARTERVTYFVALRFGNDGGVFFQGFGPFSTANQATKALESHPAAGMARGYAVVPTLTQEGMAALLERADRPAESRGNWAEVEKDKQAKRNGWGGRARDREQYL